MGSEDHKELRAILEPIVQLWAERLKPLDMKTPMTPVRDIVTDLAAAIAPHVNCSMLQAELETCRRVLAQREDAVASEVTGTLSLDEYQERALSTAIYPRKYAIIYPAMKLAGEAGEVAEKAAKVLRDNDGIFDVTRRAAIGTEVGDVLWYCAAVAHDLGFTLGEVADRNLVKLGDRAARGVLRGSGDNR